ncbi:unnamed protein product [Brassica oleracea var. botrytis]
MIAVALFDMHEYGEKRSEVKRFKCVSSGKYEEVSASFVLCYPFSSSSFVWWSTRYWSILRLS